LLIKNRVISVASCDHGSHYWILSRARWKHNRAGFGRNEFNSITTRGKNLSNERYDRSLDLIRPGESDSNPPEFDAYPRSPIEGSKVRTFMSGFNGPKTNILRKIALHFGDVSNIACDAVVNGTSSCRRLIGGGTGVGKNGALIAEAGPELVNYCESLGPGVAGSAIISPGFNLPSKFVVHVVEPFGYQPEVLYAAYLSALTLAREKQIKTIAFPCLATQYNCFPRYEAARIAVDTVGTWMRDPSNFKKIGKVIFCTYLDDDWRFYNRLIPFYLNRSAHVE